MAYDAWLAIPRNEESTLENRRDGCICSVESRGDGSKKLIVIDDNEDYRRRYTRSGRRRTPKKKGESRHVDTDNAG